MTREKDLSFGRRIWRFLISMQLALFLLLIVAAVSVFGTIIPQGEDPTFYQQAYGSLRGDLISLFDLNDVFHSWWFLGLALLLAASVLACTIDRLVPLWRQVTRFQFRYETSSYDGAPIKGEAYSQDEVKETAAQLAKRCRGRHYRVFLEERDGQVFLYADRGRFGPFGSLITHLSLLIILAGAIYGGLTGFKDYANIPEGETFTVRPAGFSIKVSDFRVDYYGDSQMPKQYYSDLTVIAGGREVLRKVIAVNDPLTYRGVTFYQSSYGWVVDGTINSQGKESKFTSLDRDVTSIGGGLSLKSFFYPDFVIDPSGHPGTRSHLPKNPRVVYALFQGSKILTYDVAKLGEPVKVNNNLSVIFTGYREYTGLQIAKDPGIPLIYSGSVLLLLGLFLSFYVFPRRIWAMVGPGQKGARVLLAAAAPRAQARLEEEIRELVETWPSKAVK
ncbi:MAG: cytochrome c biogenesis protein ResB [Firmicutes bacterium]|nr:cytochrome c biogenesis protein ResB [Bacillota bacterium]MCL5039493.1 cytochrome c biogenesis protein ResB [Bacillota bacterium]